MKVKRKSDDSGFERVIPRAMINKKKGIDVGTSHTDPYWILRNNTSKRVVLLASREVAIFSSREKAASLYEKIRKLTEAKKLFFHPEEISWNALVEEFYEYEAATLDHAGVVGFYEVIPLGKNLLKKGGKSF